MEISEALKNHVKNMVHNDNDALERRGVTEYINIQIKEAKEEKELKDMGAKKVSAAEIFGATEEKKENVATAQTHVMVEVKDKETLGSISDKIGNTRKMLTICPSRGRPKQLERMINSWGATTTLPHNYMVVLVSEDDSKIQDYRKIKAGHSGVFIAETNVRRGLVESLNYAINTFPNFDTYHCINDDHVYKTLGWDRKMYDAVMAKNDGMAVAWGNTENLPTAEVMGGKLVRHFGYYFPKEYKHSAVDLWLKHMINNVDIGVFMPDITIEHLHPIFGKAEMDDTYEVVNGDFSNGLSVFKKWMEYEAEIDIASLRMAIGQKGRTASITESLKAEIEGPKDVGDFSAAGSEICGASGAPCQFCRRPKSGGMFGKYHRCEVDCGEPQEITRWDRCPYNAPVFERLWGRFVNSLTGKETQRQSKEILFKLIMDMCNECKKK